jgi:hypothetical protein
MHMHIYVTRTDTPISTKINTTKHKQVGKVMGSSSLSPEDFFRLHRLATSGSEIGRVRQVRVCVAYAYMCMYLDGGPYN